MDDYRLTEALLCGQDESLMVDVLGYERFIAQGGDWGCLVTSWMAADHGDVCIGAHHNMWIMRPPMTDGPPDAEEQAWLDGRTKGMAKETAYQMIQATKPQTLSYGLTDSPAGLAGHHSAQGGSTLIRPPIRKSSVKRPI